MREALGFARLTTSLRAIRRTTMNILILGASRGIGLEFARQYRAAGDTVIGTARNADGLRRISALGAKAIMVDVAEPRSLRDLDGLVESQTFDIALYVAGVYTKGGATAVPELQEFDRTMRTNVLGAMLAISLIGDLVQAKGGKFVFLTSEMGRLATVDSSFGWVYRASKAALNMAVKAAQPDYPEAVFAVMNPGWVQTDMGGKDAPLKVADSVAAMRKAIAGLTSADRGTFLNYDGQRFDSW